MSIGRNVTIIIPAGTRRKPGAWLFLDRADELIVPVLGQHLVHALESNGRWAKALRRFGYDFM